MTLHSPHTINSMTGTFVFQKTDVGPLPDFNVFFKHQASYPHYSDCVWSLTQLRRWVQITEAKPSSWYSETAKEISKPAIYRKAAEILIFESKVDPNEIPAPDTTAIERQALSSLTGRFYHENGRARLIIDEVIPMPEFPDDDYPLVLLTGRGAVSQRHTQTRTSERPVLRKLYPQNAYVEIHPEDAEAIGVGNGDMVCIRSRRGEATVIACVSPTVQPGQAFMPIHYEATNKLTLRSFDPHSRQPSYKYSTVVISSAEVAAS